MSDGFFRTKEDLVIQTERVKREADRRQIEKIYIGLIFGDFLKYQNLSELAETERYGILTIVKAPTFEIGSSSRLFIFRRGQLLDIKVKNR